MRFAYYAGASTGAAAACLLKAFHERPNFYSATVYLSQSNACLLILTNLLLVCACSFIYALQRLLYGPLRPIEIEQLSEKAWYAVLDTLLAMPSFREDVGGWLLTMFVLLLAGKVWGWIGEGRVDILEQQPPANPRLFHVRLATSLVVSVLFDAFMAFYCLDAVVADPRPGMMVIFTFEFMILWIFSAFTLLRYCLSLVEQHIVKHQTHEAIEQRKGEIRVERAAARQNESADGRPTPASSPVEEPIEVDENEVDVPGWEAKRRWLFGLELATDLLKLMIYIVFFTVSITFNGLPMHIMRDVYMTFASFSKRVNDYVNYRKATSDMNTRYPDATTEEIRGDACIVCRESMVAWEQPENAPGQAQPAAAPAPARRRDEGLRAKKLPCGHILHLRCLKAWLERQQVCPTCRRPVVTAANSGGPEQAWAGGANGAAPGQPGQQRAQRQNRARIFNLGPFRIGFLNGPGDQIQNILNQMRNPEAAGQNGVEAGRQQGPNHLGLQVPYANSAPGQQGIGTGAANITPMQIQLMQIEQRLLQDAHTLGVEQQQLATLRLMEAELARLRAQIIPNQLPEGTATAAQRQQAALPNLQLPGAVPVPQLMPFGTPSTDVLQGNAGQQFGNGHEHLPPGMTLPEGWTVMPLRRAEGVNVQPMQPEPPMPNYPAPIYHSSPSVPQVTVQLPEQAAPQPIQQQSSSVNTTASSASPPAPAPAPTEAQATGPTDENGSPLFVPTATASSGEGRQNETNTPWNTTGGWDFGDEQASERRDNSNAERATDSIAATANGASTESSNGLTYEGKGKGKAVEVEEVPDTDA